MSENDTAKAETPQGHTPGPWEKCHDHPNPETARSLANIRGPIGQWGYREEIATVYGCNGEYDGEMTPDFNARLIAAAPDMLEALRGVVDAYENGGMIEPIFMARAAMAKAQEKIK